MLFQSATMKVLEEFYYKHSDELDEQWSEYLTLNDWGSGNDKIRITDDMFWEWLEEKVLVWND